jgi:hypothetical protein
MTDDDAHLWDSNRRGSTDAFNHKIEEWQERDWMIWLAENLTFPFTVTREEDEDEAYFQEGAAEAPFRLGHTMEVLGLELEDDPCGIIVKAREKRRIGHVPLCDLEVKPKTDKNCWPVREYVVWFANR